MKMCFELDDSTKTVDIITKKNGRSSIKTVTIEDFIESIIISIKKGKDAFKRKTEFIYQESSDNSMKLFHRIQIGKNSYIYFVFKPASRMPMCLYKKFFSDVGMPSLVFAIKVVNKHFSKLYVTATKEVSNIDFNTELYKYPFSNVFEDGSVCIGMNRLEDLDDVDKNILKVVESFFSMPNTGENFNMNYNDKKIEYGELLENLSGSDFNNDYLVDFKTFKEWAESL